MKHFIVSCSEIFEQEIKNGDKVANIYLCKMNKDRIDEQKLINTLKGLLKQFLPSESLPMEKQVNRYLNIKFKNLSEITNSDNNGIFYLKDGKTKFAYKAETKVNVKQL